MRSFKYIFAFIFVFSALAPGVFAQEAHKKTVTCDLKEPLAQLALLKKESEDSTPKTELALRKDILSTTMECTAREAERLIVSLEEIEPSSKKAEKLRKVYLAGLEEVVSLATVRQKSAKELETINATKKSARSAKNWRDNSYRPLAWEAAQLVVLEKNQSLIKGAEDRLSQLKKNSGALINLEGSAAITAKLTRTKDLLRNAQLATNATYDLFNQSPRTEQGPITENIKYSLDSLSETYELFLEARKSMHKFFPTTE